jgi:hypothetical protein
MTYRMITVRGSMGWCIVVSVDWSVMNADLFVQLSHGRSYFDVFKAHECALGG